VYKKWQKRLISAGFRVRRTMEKKLAIFLKSRGFAKSGAQNGKNLLCRR
jgi:hypothetical protein